MYQPSYDTVVISLKPAISLPQVTLFVTDRLQILTEDFSGHTLLAFWVALFIMWWGSHQVECLSLW